MVSYALPRELIAKQPCHPRDSARLLILDRAAGKIAHRTFRDLPAFLQPGDCLVLNDTKVLPARIFGRRAETGGKVELLLLSPSSYPSPPGGGEEKVEGVSIYRCLGKPGKGLQPGTRFLLHGARHQNGKGARHPLVGEVLSANGQERIVRFVGFTPRPSTSSGQTEEEVLFQLGEIPLPPYIDRPVTPQDADWYQTVYAREPGAVAAPTAGLHFTQELLDRIRTMGVKVAFVTLHVGWGTFKPVSEEEIKEDKLHPERFCLPKETAEAINETKRRGGRVIAVGTTVVRVLETCATGPAAGRSALGPSARCGVSSALRASSVRALTVSRPSPSMASLFVGRRSSHAGHPRVTRGQVTSREGTTDLFIRPPFEFKVVDAMVTNFHLPGTSLLSLVAAFAGEEKIMGAYQEAIRERYRFYSYGDAMLIL